MEKKSHGGGGLRLMDEKRERMTKMPIEQGGSKLSIFPADVKPPQIIDGESYPQQHPFNKIAIKEIFPTP